MTPEITLTTNRLKLRVLKPKDAAGYSQLGVSYRSTGPIDNEQKAREYLSKEEKDSFDIGIFLGDELVGTIEVCHMSWFDNEGAEICYTVKESHRNKGVATEACKGIINYLFSSMKMHKIYADTIEDNIASQRILEKLGFKLEGTIRDRRKKNGTWLDELQYGLLEDEWH